MVISYGETWSLLQTAWLIYSKVGDATVFSERLFKWNTALGNAITIVKTLQPRCSHLETQRETCALVSLISYKLQSDVTTIEEYLIVTRDIIEGKVVSPATCIFMISTFCQAFFSNSAYEVHGWKYHGCRSRFFIWNRLHNHLNDFASNSFN